MIVIADEASVSQVLKPLESAWPARSAPPRYVFMTNLPPSVLDWVGASPPLRRRFFGLAPITTTPPNVRFVARFNEGAANKITLAAGPNTSYDAFYLLAYATYALGERPVTGANLASAIARLVPPGKAVDVGPAGIYGAFDALRRGENINLSGAAGPLDFDLATGEAPVDMDVLVAGPGLHPENVPSGVVYRDATRTLDGKLR